MKSINLIGLPEKSIKDLEDLRDTSLHELLKQGWEFDNYSRSSNSISYKNKKRNLKLTHYLGINEGKRELENI